MSDGITDSEKDNTLSGELPPGSFTYAPMPKEYKVLDVTDDYFVFEREDKTIGAVKREHVRITTISGFLG